MSTFIMEIVPLRDAPLPCLRELTLPMRLEQSRGRGTRHIIVSGMQTLLNRAHAEGVEAYAVLGQVDLRVVGWAGLEVARGPWPDPDMFVSVFVHPQFRRRGYGSALVHAGLGFTRDTHPHLTPCCFPSDEAGFQTFLKAGFEFHPERQKRFA